MLPSCIQVGPSVQKYLPEDLNPKIKEQLDNEMGGPQGTGPPPGAPPAAASSSSAPAPAKKPAANSSRKKSDADRAAQQHVHQAEAVQRGQHQAQDHALAGIACFPVYHYRVVEQTLHTGLLHLFYVGSTEQIYDIEVLTWHCRVVH